MSTTVREHSQMSGIGPEALQDVRDSSGGPPLCPGVVGRPSKNDQEWSGGPLAWPGFVERPSRMSGSGRESLKNIREWLGTIPNVRDWIEVPPGCPGVVGSPSHMFGNGWEALPDAGSGRDAF